jgi:S-DNA-T family DNA segregation ATPase FtsK/SpoIIIE
LLVFLKYFLIIVGVLAGGLILYLAVTGFWKGLIRLKKERLHEILGILLFLFFVFLLVSLFSFRTADRENLTTGKVLNFGGVVGAVVSHWCFRYIGIPIFLLTVLIPLWGFFLISHKNVGRLLKPSALLILFSYWSTLLWALRPFNTLIKKSIPISGVIGVASANFLVKFTGTIGAYIIIFIFLILTIFTLTELSFTQVFNKLKSISPKKKGEKREKKRKPLKTTKKEEKKPSFEEKEVSVEKGRKTEEQLIEEVPEKFPPTIRSSEEILKIEIDDSFKQDFLTYLNDPPPSEPEITEGELQENARKLEEKLTNFGVSGSVTSIGTGPVITRYEFVPGPGVKVSRISSLANDLALAMKAPKIRVVAPIPGKGTVGIEVPNKKRQNVFIKELLMSKEFNRTTSYLTIGLGKDIAGEPVLANIARMPHLLIAGATGSGKSVCINTIIASILYRSKPRDVRFVMIDPKRLELPVYNGIPHLIFPVLTESKESIMMLKQVLEWMEIRYREFAKVGVRDIEGYNEKIEEKKPYILVIVDELADLMIQASGEIEATLTRLAQMSRAVGIHLILATQRPSVDVITGLIKANFPARIAFQVASMTDSRTILDMIGAEKLLGRGDMLFLPPGKGTPVRLHGAYIATDEAKSIANHWSELHLKNLLKNEIEHSVEISREVIGRNIIESIVNSNQIPGAEERIIGFSEEMAEKYKIEVEKLATLFYNLEYYPPLEEQRRTEKVRPGESGYTTREEMDDELDEFFDEARHIVIRHQQASVSLLQRKLKVGYARAGRIIDQLERAGIVGPFEGSKPRKVLVGRPESEQQ